MNSQRLRINSIDNSSRTNIVQVEFQTPARCHDIYFQSEDVKLAGNLDALLTCALLPAMREALDIVAEGTVSHRLADSFPTIMSIFRAWDPSLHAVEIHGAVPAKQSPQVEGRVGTFFTGGVDSFYTFLKHRDEISDLIYVHGFDVGLDNRTLYQKTSAMIQNVATEFNKRYITIESNLGTLLNPYVYWGLLGHGAASQPSAIFSPLIIASFTSRRHIRTPICILGAPIPCWILSGAQTYSNLNMMDARQRAFRR